MLRKLFFSLFIIAMCHSSIAQQKWDLRKCVDYALANNITVKQTYIQSKISTLQYNQSKQGQFPTLNFSGSPSYNSGRNQDPTSFSLITQSYLSANMQLQSSVDIFNWYSKQNTIAANKWEAEAARASTDKLKDDIALAVSNSYLQILLTMEQEKIAKVQLEQTQQQLKNTRKLVNAGSLPELNAAELKAQVARDSSTVVSAKGNVEQAMLNLKAYMSLDAATPFEIVAPPVEFIPIEKIADLQPENVYALAIANLPQQRVNDFKLKAAQKNSASAKSKMYPTIAAFASLGSGYNSRAQEITGVTLINAPIGKVSISGTDYSVYPSQPYSSYNYSKTKFFRQLDENFRQSIGLSLSVPIFNGGNLRTNWERSKLTVKNLELQKEADNQKIKQDIYQAYNAAIVAMEKFNASKKSVETAERSYSYAQKRYDVGMLTTLELVTNQNNLLRAKLELVQNQFDYVFKMKVLEFYKGQGLKL
ncbi:TolC family protein [Ferruginibacter lapsinanis]|uniref:TolC family protein n=1 Tax=Ferruginibacter lapsinanis TaxID=563172 RepID=UPI001E61686D|nr:TolC family protein [Ferruginibacter lapsinanis]UEG50522.1 TolC family protein [Ferruginibacter lapsinanis]